MVATLTIISSGFESAALHTPSIFSSIPLPTAPSGALYKGLGRSRFYSLEPLVTDDSVIGPTIHWGRRDRTESVRPKMPVEPITESVRPSDGSLQLKNSSLRSESCSLRSERSDASRTKRSEKGRDDLELVHILTDGNGLQPNSNDTLIAMASTLVAMILQKAEEVPPGTCGSGLNGRKRSLQGICMDLPDLCQLGCIRRLQSDIPWCSGIRCK